MGTNRAVVTDDDPGEQFVIGCNAIAVTDDGMRDGATGANLVVVPEHARADGGAVSDGAASTDNGGTFNGHIRSNGNTLLDDHRAADGGVSGDGDPRRHPQAGALLGAGETETHVAVEDVVVDFEVGLRFADVGPVGITSEAVHGVLVVEGGREETTFEHVVLPGGNVVEQVWLHDVGASVNHVGSDFFGARFFEEAGNATFCGRFHQAKSGGVFDGG